MNEDTTTASIPGEPHGRALGKPYFVCNKQTMTDCIQGRNKGKHWRKFLRSTPGLADEVKSFLSKNPKQKSFLLKSEDSDEFITANREWY